MLVDEAELVNEVVLGLDWIIEMPAMGMSSGEGVRVNCLLKEKIGMILLSLLMDSFPILLLIWMLGAMFYLIRSMDYCMMKFSSLVIEIG